MIRHYIRAMVVRTTLFIMIGLALLLTLSQPALAQNPPPRPTVEPTATPTITPSATPMVAPTITPTPAPTVDNGPSPTDTPAGRIIGTVIDLTTGAPAPGITVAVGDVTVTTDANGNYDRTGLPAGSYQVALVLTAAQGIAAQGPITIELAAGQTVVQHLAFSSPVAATATPAPATAAPTLIPPTSTPTSAPTGPVTLPDTGTSAPQTTIFSTGLLGGAILLLGIGIWGLTEWSRRKAVKTRSV